MRNNRTLVRASNTSTRGKKLKHNFISTFFQIWNLDTMLPMQTLSRHEGSVNCVVIHKDLLLSGSEDMEIKVCIVAVRLVLRSNFSNI